MRGNRSSLPAGDGITGFFVHIRDKALNAYRGSSCRSSIFMKAAGDLIKIMFPDGGTREYFSDAFDHIRVKDGVEPELGIVCYEADRGFLEEILRVFPGFSPEVSRDVPYISREGIIMAPGRESCSLSVLDVCSGSGVFLFEDRGKLPYYEKGSPLKNIFQWWFDFRGSPLIHSGAVGTNGKAVLISGRGGSGKSTTALSCLMKGMDYFGDDYVIVSEDSGFRVSSLYGSLKLTSRSSDMFPGIKPCISGGGSGNEEKAVFFPGPGLRKNPISRPALQAIVLPYVVMGQPSFVERVSPSAVFRAVAPSTVFQNIGRNDTIAGFAGRMSRSVRGYRLYAGTDIERIPGIILSILEENP